MVLKNVVGFLKTFLAWSILKRKSTHIETRRRPVKLFDVGPDACESIMRIRIERNKYEPVVHTNHIGSVAKKVEGHIERVLIEQ